MGFAWYGVHTVVRPVGGALIAVASIGHAVPAMQAAAVAGAALAMSTHAAKAGRRAVTNTRPEPFSNWTLTITEDGFAVALGLLALRHPVVVVAGPGVIAVAAGWLIRGLRRRLGPLLAQGVVTSSSQREEHFVGRQIAGTGENDAHSAPDRRLPAEGVFAVPPSVGSNPSLRLRSLRPPRRLQRRWSSCECRRCSP